MKESAEMKEETIRKYVRNRYAGIARQGNSCCGPNASYGDATAELAARSIGYSEEEVTSVPEGSNLGLGCGNPVAQASLKAGETVLDLGSGAGFDCFLAARGVGPGGRVIGVDMTPEMVEKARGNARRAGFENIEFRLGEIERLPVADGSVDAVISNCVINLSPAKEQVFSEAFRVLRPGGRLMVSDIVLSRELPESVAASLTAYAGCIAGAIRKEEYLRMIEEAGFRDVRIVTENRFEIPENEVDSYAKAIAGDLPVSPEAVREAAEAVVSVSLFGTRPASTA
jgi:arsenite methyltransferase